MVTDFYATTAWHFDHFWSLGTVIVTVTATGRTPLDAQHTQLPVAPNLDVQDHPYPLLKIEIVGATL